MTMRIEQSPPFSIRLLNHNDGGDAGAAPLDDHQLIPLLPATYRTESDDLAAPSRHVFACIKTELDLHRLNKVSGWLWIAGRLMPPRPLHHQLLLSRDVFVTEQMNMHLVWTTTRIFVKPIPRFLLEPCFWTEYLCCGEDATALRVKLIPEEACRNASVDSFGNVRLGSYSPTPR
ncbi:hypothetical protein B0J13DRAFT_629578 [Dactylonectria estremocensis]|uniref:Uncharacterized protein n=1 Tax=Dactylonectria estremocensis TaxID=1079267 RepID=A0A9P9DHR3_9HYPO|nr:hypothetical protein B0J13DRAFT_629578 [Dactylonectria estremocensis]